VGSRTARTMGLWVRATRDIGVAMSTFVQVELVEMLIKIEIIVNISNNYNNNNISNNNNVNTRPADAATIPLHCHFFDLIFIYIANTFFFYFMELG
jgi:hypothetical protein